VRAFPEDVKDEVGVALAAVPYGRDHPGLKVLRGFGSAGVQEIRVNDAAGTFRVVYTVQFKEVVYRLHAFQKKSKSGSKTPKEEMEREERRLAAAKAHHEQPFG
jgi:phage-related protein